MESTGVTIDMIRNDNRTFTLTFTDQNGAAIDIKCNRGQVVPSK